MEQKCSLFGLQYKEDPTVILLYRIAKEALDHHLQDHQSTIDSLVDVTKETQKQFKRILEATIENEPNLKRVRNLASAGVLYTETCLHKYRWQYNTDYDEMPTPSDLPPSVELPKERSDIDILQTIPPEILDDMKYAREFKNEYLKTHKQMNWKVCYENGRADGYFTRYKNYKTLKNTFNEANT